MDKKKFTVIGVMLLISAFCVQSEQKKVLFLPFKDKVQLSEAWELSVDIPRWYSTTVDTIGLQKKVLSIADFDSVYKFVQTSKWNRKELLDKRAIVRIASIFNADMIITGTVEKFSVAMHAVNSSGEVGGAYGNSGVSNSQGSTPVIGGIQSYSAKIRMKIDFYSGTSGQIIDTLSLDSDERDSGLKLWLPVQEDSDELNFYYLSRTPFGSEYFLKSVPGAIMKKFSQKIKDRLVEENKNESTTTGATDKIQNLDIEGVILEREDSEVYLNLGSADLITSGVMVDVYRPGKAIVGESGDTLGFTEKKVGVVQVRSVKAAHFSSASIIEETDTIKTSWSVRVKK